MRQSSHPVARPACARLAGATLAALAIPAAAWASRDERPRVYALTGATVIQAPGRSIESGTVVLRDGLIEAVGAAAPIPPDAVEIDCRGRFVYPGWIDADSRLGFRIEEPARARGAASPEPSPGAVHPNPRVRPELRARDLLLPFTEDRQREMERYRSLGFTTILATPARGVFRGTSAAVQLVDGRSVAQTILRDGVAQHAAFEHGGFGEGYPTSLMGAVALIRQTLLDASRHAIWAARYQARPQGLRRPEQAAADEALAGVVGGSQPLFVTVDDPEDALLADRLGREFGLRLVISGSGHEWELAEALAATRRTLILPAAFPDKPDVDDPDGALDVSRKEMLRYLEAPAGPGRLHRAGVRFALTTRGLKNSAELPANMRKIIEAGVPADAALAAWTTVPAELLGLARVLGTLEVGKIANLVVADGPLFGEETKLRLVFVDGIEHKVEVKEKPKGDPSAVVDPRGDWSVVFEIGGRVIERDWTLGGARDHYTGTAETQGGTVDFQSVHLEGNALTVTYVAPGGADTTEVTVILEGDSFEGVAEMGSRSVKVRGTRTAGPPGTAP